MNYDYIKLNRSLYDHEIWTCEPFSKGQAWVDLLMRANWQRTEKIFRGKAYVIERGQLVTSVDALSKRWKWHRNKVSRYITLLCELGMVHKVRILCGTLLTIENYDSFQGQWDTDEASREASNGAKHGAKHGSYNKNIKNNKKNKKEAIPFVEGIGY